MYNQFLEKIIQVKRVSKVVKGGKNLSFISIVIIGNFKGFAGFGIGKSKDYTISIKKAILDAKLNMIHFPINNFGSLNHKIVKKLKNNIYILEPGKFGNHIKGPKYLIPLFEYAGYNNITLKVIGTKNILKNLRNLKLLINNYKLKFYEN